MSHLSSCDFVLGHSGAFSILFSLYGVDEDLLSKYERDCANLKGKICIVLSHLDLSYSVPYKHMHRQSVFPVSMQHSQDNDV